MAVKWLVQFADSTCTSPCVPIDGSGSGWVSLRTVHKNNCASRRIHIKRNTIMADYIPGPDANFQAWQSNFVTYANANLAAS